MGVEKRGGVGASVRRFPRNLGEGYAPSIDPTTYTGTGWYGVPLVDPKYQPYFDATSKAVDEYTAQMGGAGWKKYTGGMATSADAVEYQQWEKDHYGFRDFLAQKHPDIYTWFTTNSGIPTIVLQAALGPNFQMLPGDLGSLSDAVAYSDKVMSDFERASKIKLAIALAAAVGGAAAAGAFSGAGASQVVADTATQAATAGGEIAPITLPASAVYLPTSVAPTILSPTASLLSMPVFDAGAAATLADQLAASVNTPEMQAAIASGAVPPAPTGLGSSAFTKWATSTGVKYLEQQLGRALTPQEQASVEDQMAAEIRRLQAQLAQNPAAAPYMGATDWGALLPYLAIGGAVILGTSLLAA